MSLYEARLAGGTFLYSVERDPKNWSDDVSPLVIIDKQEVAPDESKIWLTFENATQFASEGKQRFEVYFTHGKAQEIRRLAANQPHPAEVISEILLKQNKPTSPDAEINESDYGIYAVFHRRDYLPTGLFFRLSKNDDKWVMEGKAAGDDWKNTTCDNGCEYRTSFDIEVQIYFPTEWMANADIACIQNMAQAFCRITEKKDAAKIGHMLISLIAGMPIPVYIKRFIGHE
jgi:hypothetical protein